MSLEGLVVTGAKASGKTTIVRRLCELDSRFAHVKAVTTRPKRPDDREDEFEFLSNEEFEDLKARDELRVHAHYFGNNYGIKKSAIAAELARKKIPVLTITPESAVKFFGVTKDGVATASDSSPAYLLIFLRWPDEVLEQRSSDRGDADETQERQKQREHDNSFQGQFTYVLDRTEVDDCARLLSALWHNESGILSARLIHLLLKCGTLLSGADAEKVAPASYDLQLGDKIFYGGRIQQLNDANPIHLIEPYDYAIVTSRESAQFPADIAARFDLTVSLFCQGVILSNGPQVDPGFTGPLFCLLLNTSSSPVALKRGQHYATLEFHRLPEPTYPYSGPYLKKELIDYLPSNAAQGAINTLKKEIEGLRAESGRLQNLIVSIIALLLAFLAVWVALK
jgi:guanylate kinase/deoxycytidine triphosphate deaminase